MISLDLYGTPVASARPRFNFASKHAYEAPEQTKLKEGAKWQLKSQYREEPLWCPVIVDIIFFMPIPGSTSKPKKRQMLNGILHHITKPDIDNLQKFVLDCLCGIVIQDDRRVVEIHASKKYSSKPGTLIRIYPVDASKPQESRECT
jgi:Holliday junction resolvase RusA-like endonuclease